jgi:hypothetical protein
MAFSNTVELIVCAHSPERHAGLDDDDLEEEELPISSGRPTTLTKPSSTAAKPATSAAKPATTAAAKPAALKTPAPAAKPAIKKTIVKEEEYDIDYGEVDTVNDDVF